MENLNYLKLQPSTQKFFLIPYSTGMEINPGLTGIRNRQTHKLSCLQTLFEKSGNTWMDTMTSTGHLQVASIENGEVLFTAVFPTEFLVRIIEKVDGTLTYIKHRSSERMLEDLVKISTEKVLVLILGSRFDYTDLDLITGKEAFFALTESLSSALPHKGFVPYNPKYMRRGAVLKLEDGRRAVAFLGMHLANEPIEPSLPLQALVIDSTSADNMSDNLLWVISDTGILANRTRPLIHPQYVCPPEVMDKLTFFCKCFLIADNNRISEKTFKIDEAFMLAARIYYGIKDFTGNPYLLHVFKVVERMKTDTERICAILHDALAVSPETNVNILFEEGVPISILQALVALTRNPDESCFDYIQRVKKNALATTVKKECLLHDMDISRLGRKPTKEDFERKYQFQRAYTLLTSK